MALATSLKSVTISDDLASHPELADAVEKANALLPDVLDRSVDSTAVQWDVARSQQGRLLLQMRLKDGVTGSEQTARFAPEEFSDEWRLRHRLYRVWGDLLAERSERAMRELREAVRRLDDA